VTAELDRLLKGGGPNVEVRSLNNAVGAFPSEFQGACLICRIIRGRYGQGFVNDYSSPGRAIGALKLHFAATHYGLRVIA